MTIFHTIPQGKWEATRDERGNWLMTYTDLVKNESFDCGKNRPETSFKMMMDFIMAAGQGGDLVHIEGFEPFTLPAQEGKA